MSAETAPASRPLLLPQNRKIRHLRGLYLRNLSFTRPRGRTVDDAAIIESPGRREAPQLHHALSSESLRQPAAASEKRRRSTNLSGAAPFTRQKKLEYAVESRIADSFFSLHCRGEKDAVYISEVSERATVRELAYPPMHAVYFSSYFSSYSTLLPPLLLSLASPYVLGFDLCVLC